MSSTWSNNAWAKNAPDAPPSNDRQQRNAWWKSDGWATKPAEAEAKSAEAS